MASVAIEAWADDCATIEEIEDALADLRLRVGHRGVPDLRTSVLTHMAWVPQEWQTAATETLAGLGEQHPSRTLLLFPEPAEGDRLAARVFLECHPLEGDGRQLCNEVVELRLGGPRSEAPASVAMPLLLPDLPVFIRWRGRPPFRTEQFRQMIEIVDRLIVDSAEWPDVPGAYAELEDGFDAAAVSDIAWRRTLPWREALAAAWPELPERIAGPPAETALVAAWLRSRAGVDVARESADQIPHREELKPSELLSEELNVFERDPVYEDAARIAGRM
jgi:glucose-6-phosphate dehydrogenase assembly protein OpcA